MNRKGGIAQPFLNYSGDVGNRTRVRKIRPANIYEHSRLIGFALRVATDNSGRRANRWNPKVPLSCNERCGCTALQLCHARSCLRLEFGACGRGPTSEGQPLRQSPKRRGAEQRSLCGWHFSFALIYRGRRLSARNSGSASPVETFHPR